MIFNENKLCVSLKNGRIAILEPEEWHTYEPEEIINTIQADSNKKFFLNTSKNGIFFKEGSLIWAFPMKTMRSKNPFVYVNVSYSRCFLSSDNNILIYNIKRLEDSPSEIPFSQFLESFNAKRNPATSITSEIKIMDTNAKTLISLYSK